MNVANSEEIDQFFDSKIWIEPLLKFAKATGLTISLYDKNILRRCAVTDTSPIGIRLTQADFWAEKGLGAEIDASAARECAGKKELIYTVQMDLFAHLAMPIIVDDIVLAIFVIGWLPEKFADPVLCDQLSKKIGAAHAEVWQILRMQQPISKEKLESHARMLETFAVPLTKQLMVHTEERRRAVKARIFSETVQAFAEATNENDLTRIAIKSIQNLTKTNFITIEILKMRGEVEEKVRYDSTKSTPSDSPSNFNNLQSQLTISIPTAQNSILGTIDIRFIEKTVSDDTINDLQTIAAHLGTALQKVHLIHALESERSALKGANIELQHLHKMKDEFLATVSHELRTPLNAILGWSQILQDEGPNSSDFTSGLETIERNARNQSNLIEDLLDVSRIISGKMSLQREDVEATSLLRESLKTVYPMTEARRQKLHLQISKTPIYLKGDATRITQIFWNLLSNASKFTPEGGDISVLLENAGHYFRLEIADSGKGISSEFLPNLFNRFSQADSSYTRRHGGLGLGLAIVRHLVELHGGTVSATSEGENKGSVFTVYLPQNTTDKELDHAQVMTQYGTNKNEKPNLKLSGVKILIVDDEPDSLRLTRFVLEKYGASINMADSAKEAYQKLRDWHPDILISDISMPGESGYELIRRIRYLSDADGGNVPAVALTALASKEQKELALDAGFHLHLSKPLEPNILTSSVLNLLKDQSQILKH